MKLEQTPWNITEVFCTSGNQKKGNPCIRKSEKRKPLYSIRTPSTFACLQHGVDLEINVQNFVHYSSTLFIFRAGGLSSELRLLMSFSWPFFPGLDQVLFSPWFSWFLGFDSKTVQRSALCRSRRELSNAYFVAKVGLDTAENEPCQVCPIEQCSSQPTGTGTQRRAASPPRSAARRMGRSRAPT